jgi:hypothetical protein
MARSRPGGPTVPATNMPMCRFPDGGRTFPDPTQVGAATQGDGALPELRR